MIERIKNTNIETDRVTKVWSVASFCKRHRLDKQEEKRLKQLFGDFASAHELLHNAHRGPRWRD